jgi:hypothetical protein
MKKLQLLLRCHTGHIFFLNLYFNNNFPWSSYSNGWRLVQYSLFTSSFENRKLHLVCLVVFMVWSSVLSLNQCMLTKIMHAGRQIWTRWFDSVNGWTDKHMYGIGWWVLYEAGWVMLTIIIHNMITWWNIVQCCWCRHADKNHTCCYTKLSSHADNNHACWYTHV